VAVGRGITTEEATIYNWNGIQIVDTPGICTGLRSDHDEISRQAIADAEILMYVVTYEGFDKTVAEEFRKIIVDGDKAPDTILIVNKMASANDGNTPEQRDIIAEDLAKATAPYTPEQLRTTFIDAKAYLRSKELEDQNPRRAKRLRDESNMDELFGVIESLARGANLGPRLTRPLYLTIDVLSDAKAKLAGGEGEDGYSVMREGLLEERSILIRTITSMQANVRSLSARAASEIRRIGSDTSEKVLGCESNEEANALLADASASAIQISDKCAAEITESINASVQHFQSEIDDFHNTFDNRVEAFIKNGGDGDKNPLIGLFDRANINYFVNLVDKFTIKDGTAEGLKQFAGGDVHLFIRWLLKKMNIRLKPWGAVKIARGVNVAGKVIGAAGALLDLGLQAKDDADAEARMQQEKELRNQVRSSFNEFARQLEDGNNDCFKRILAERDGFEPRLAQIRAALAALEQAEQRKSSGNVKLDKLIDECGTLIREIHATC